MCLTKNTWKYQHCLLLTKFLDSSTFPFSYGKWEREKPQIHWCFHCRMVVSYTLITRWKKALTSKLQSVNNWVHNHNHGLVVKRFLQLQKPCLPLSSRVSMVCVHQCFVRREIQNWEHHMVWGKRAEETAENSGISRVQIFLSVKNVGACYVFIVDLIIFFAIDLAFSKHHNLQIWTHFHQAFLDKEWSGAQVQAVYPCVSFCKNEIKQIPAHKEACQLLHLESA